MQNYTPIIPLAIKGIIGVITSTELLSIPAYKIFIVIISLVFVNFQSNELILHCKMNII